MEGAGAEGASTRSSGGTSRGVDELGNPSFADDASRQTRQTGGGSANERLDTVDCVMAGIGYYLMSSLIVAVSVVFSARFVETCMRHPDASRMDRSNFFEWFGPWDSVWFRQIVDQGYSYDPERMSNVAFFPLYPMIGKVVSQLSGASSEVALFMVANVLLLGCFGLLGLYLAKRDPRPSPQQLAGSLIAFAFFPTCFYHHMSYTESTFLFCALLSMLGIQRRWNPWWIAILVGLSTASRPVGVALVLPFAWSMWISRKSFWRFTGRMAMLAPVCVWGLLAYMAYLQFAVGDGLAFAKTQIHWYERMPPDWPRYLFELAMLEPFWSVYLPSSECYWGNRPPEDSDLFNMHFWNPIFVAATWALIAFGTWRRVLTRHESWFCLGVLGIPYAIHAYRSCMASEARYASVAFPTFIVMGWLLSKLPAPMANVVIGISCVMMFVFASLFVNWYWYY